MNTIWKATITTGRQSVKMPAGSRFLSAQLQSGIMTVWYIADAALETVQRVVSVYGTGHPLPDEPGEYVGTVQQGPFVWHVFADKVS